MATRPDVDGSVAVVSDSVIRILGLNDGTPTAYDGQWVTAYDPCIAGASPDGQPMLAYLTATPDKSKARRFTDVTELYKFMMAPAGRRPDGQLNRPLTAFNLMIEPAEGDQ